MSDKKALQIAVAGTTDHTLREILVLDQDDRFKISWILTPQPRKVGRQQQLTTNPVHSWAKENNVQTVLVNKSINQNIQQQIQQLNQNKDRVDILLVVDFGYIIPQWLLTWPTINTVNLHPSLLPKWRGSSPGQFVILYHEKQSAITLMELEEKLDTGAVIKQMPFTAENGWTSQDYYQHSFQLASQHLAEWLWQYAQGELKPKPQPKQSPTRIARRLTKNDAYLPWKIIQAAQNIIEETAVSPTNLDWPKRSVLKDVILQKKTKEWPQTIKQASLAFQPWPILWTKIPTNKGRKRMQILACQVASNPQPTLILDQVKIAGQNQAQWNQVKNIVRK